MAKRIIMFMSDLKYNKQSEDGLEKMMHYTGVGQDGKEITVQGRHTDEAPVKYLLKTYGAMDQIIYLQTSEVSERVLPSPANLCAEDYFKKTIDVFLEELAYPHTPEHFWHSISYEPNESLMQTAAGKILDQIRPEDEIYLEVTGGPRDANFLMILLMQAVRYRNCKVGDIVYSNFQNHRIISLNYTVDLFQLINGLNEFVSFGSSRTLCQSLHKMAKTSDSMGDAIAELSKAIQALTDAILLCRIGEPLTKAVDGFNGALANCKQRLNQPSKAGTSHPFLGSLIQIMEEKMNLGTEQLDTYALLRWCVSNRMIQQALTIYVEELPKWLLDRSAGRLSFSEEQWQRAKKYQDHHRPRRYTSEESYLMYAPITYGRMDSREGKVQLSPSNRFDNEYLFTHFSEFCEAAGISSNAAMEEQIKLVFLDYSFLKNLRNQMNHAGQAHNNLTVLRQLAPECCYPRDENLNSVNALYTLLSGVLSRLRPFHATREEACV